MNSKLTMAFTASKIHDLVNALSKARCDYRFMDDAYISSFEHPQLLHDNHGEPLRVGDAYMIITAENGYAYYINVTADSPYTACAEVFNFIQHRL